MVATTVLLSGNVGDYFTDSTEIVERTRRGENVSRTMTDTPAYSVVIPSNRETVRTLETVPETAEVVVRRDAGLNVARNAGVRAASNEWIVLADDDIGFPTELVETTLRTIDTETVAGLADFPPLRWVIGRLMIFHRGLWQRVGGFDESRAHGGDTDFAIRVEKAGGTVRQLDRSAVPHYDTDTGDTMALSGHIEWMAYLSMRHPVVFAPIAARLMATKCRQMAPKLSASAEAIDD